MACRLQVSIKQRILSSLSGRANSGTEPARACKSNPLGLAYTYRQTQRDEMVAAQKIKKKQSESDDSQKNGHAPLLQVFSRTWWLSLSSQSQPALTFAISASPLEVNTGDCEANNQITWNQARINQIHKHYEMMRKSSLGIKDEPLSDERCNLIHRHIGLAVFISSYIRGTLFHLS